MQTSLDLALIRWSVMSDRWKDIGGDQPMLGAFLAGWFLRDMSPRGTQPPDVASFRDSFRVGWREADDQIEIASRSVATPQVFGSEQPSVEGWHWLRRNGEGLIVDCRKLRAFGGRLCACLAQRGWVPVEEMEADWQWAGPIPRPIILPPDEREEIKQRHSGEFRDEDWPETNQNRGALRGVGPEAPKSPTAPGCTPAQEQEERL